MPTLRDALKEFLEKNITGPKTYKEMVQRLILGYTKKEKQTNPNIVPNKYALIQQYSISEYLDYELNNFEMHQSLQIAFKESVVSYTRDKNTLIDIYKKFIGFIRIKYKISIPIQWPPIFSSELDRQMFIVKELHEKGKGVEYFEDRLWIGCRTIEEDLRKLRDYEGIKIMDQKFRVDGMERKNGVIEFSSTVHPIFLSLNLTQVVVMLNGLKSIAENEVYKEYAFKMAVTIWRELSSYAKNRIFEVSDMLSLDKNWYSKINSIDTKEMFFTEQNLSSNYGAGNIMFFLKNGKKCTIEYVDNDGENKIIPDIKIVKYEPQEDYIIAKKNNDEIKIDLSNIIRAVKDKMYLF